MTPSWSDDAIVIVGRVKEVFSEPDLYSMSMASFSDSQEWTIIIPSDIATPDVGRAVAISCHATDSGLMLDSLRVL